MMPPDEPPGGATVPDMSPGGIDVTAPLLSKLPTTNTARTVKPNKTTTTAPTMMTLVRVELWFQKLILSPSSISRV
jgi:hypothetical protein